MRMLLFRRRRGRRIMCIGVDAFWYYDEGVWYGVSPVVPDFTGDPFDPPLGGAVFLRGTI